MLVCNFFSSFALFFTVSVILSSFISIYPHSSLSTLSPFSILSLFVLLPCLNTLSSLYLYASLSLSLSLSLSFSVPSFCIFSLFLFISSSQISLTLSIFPSYFSYLSPLSPYSPRFFSCFRSLSLRWSSEGSTMKNFIVCTVHLI